MRLLFVLRLVRRFRRGKDAAVMITVLFVRSVSVSVPMPMPMLVQCFGGRNTGVDPPNVVLLLVTLWALMGFGGLVSFLTVERRSF